MADEKQIETLTNGTEIKTTPKGWDNPNTYNKPVLITGWASQPHFPIGMDLAVAISKSEHPDLKPYVKGLYEAKNEAGDSKEIPTLDNSFVQIFREAVIEKFDLDVQPIRVASNKIGLKKQLDNNIAQMETTYSAIASNPDVMALLKEQNPSEYEKALPFVPK